MSDPSVVYDLLKNGKAVALVHEPSFDSMLQNAPIPTFPGGDDCFDKSLEDLPSVSPWHPAKADDVLCVYHTSGSTSGIPKLVPVTAKWMTHVLGLSQTWEERCNKSRERMIGLQM